MTDDDDEEFETVGQVANHLDCHPKTVRRRIASGDLPAYRFGGQIRVKRADRKAYEHARRIKPKACP